MSCGAYVCPHCGHRFEQTGLAAPKRDCCAMQRAVQVRLDEFDAMLAADAEQEGDRLRHSAALARIVAAQANAPQPKRSEPPIAYTKDRVLRSAQKTDLFASQPWRNRRKGR